MDREVVDNDWQKGKVNMVDRQPERKLQSQQYEAKTTPGAKRLDFEQSIKWKVEMNINKKHQKRQTLHETENETTTRKTKARTQITGQDGNNNKHDHRKAKTPQTNRKTTKPTRRGERTYNGAVFLVRVDVVEREERRVGHERL